MPRQRADVGVTGAQRRRRTSQKLLARRILNAANSDIRQDWSTQQEAGSQAWSTWDPALP